MRYTAATCDPNDFTPEVGETSLNTGKIVCSFVASTERLQLTSFFLWSWNRSPSLYRKSPFAFLPSCICILRSHSSRSPDRLQREQDPPRSNSTRFDVEHPWYGEREILRVPYESRRIWWSRRRKNWRSLEEDRRVFGLRWNWTRW